MTRTPAVRPLAEALAAVPRPPALRMPAGMAAAAALVAAAVLVAAFPLAAQEGAAEGPPEGWEVRLDRPGSEADVSFREMAPGWHVTTGPAAILYDPSTTASGEYRAEAEIHLFDPGERREGFGILFGGTDLEGDGQAYGYFLLRRDGSFLVKRRDGSETAEIEGWTEHPTVVSWDEREEGAETVTNVLAVDVGAEEVAFLVNGQEVHRMSKADLRTDGIVGLRVNHGLNLHVSRLEVTGSGEGG